MKKTALRTDLLIISALFMFTFFAMSGVARAQQAITVNGQGAIVSASSYCDEYEDIEFTPAKAFNGNPERPWMASKNFDPKKGEWIQLTFTKPVRLMALRITPGFGHKNLYKDYSRLKKFEVILDKGGKEQVRTYNRRFDSNSRKDMVLLYSTHPTVKSIKINILENYPGMKSRYSVIGNIEPIVMVEGKIYSSSWAVDDAISFLKSTASPGAAFSFVAPGKGITITRVIRNSNPLDPENKKVKAKKYNRETLKNDWDTWSNLCYMMSQDYRFKSYEGVSYFWKDTRTNLMMFDFFASETADTPDSYTFGMTRRKVTEKIKKKDEETGEETEEIITVLKTVVTTMTVMQETWTP